MNDASEHSAPSECAHDVNNNGGHPLTPRSRQSKQRPPVLSLARSCNLSMPTQPPPQRRRKEEVSSYGTIYGASSRRGRRRVHREDRYIALPFVSHLDDKMDLSVFGVFDGHGGQRAAKFASKRLPELLLRNLSLSAVGKHDALRRAFLRTDHDFLSGRVLDSASFRRTRTSDFGASRSKSGSRFMALALHHSASFISSPELLRSKSSTSKCDMTSDGPDGFSESSPPSLVGDMPAASGPPRLRRRSSSRAEDQVANLSATPNPTCGTTATIVLLSGEDLVVAHVGDSRAVINCGGRALRLCEDHRPGRADETARIESAGGLILRVGGTYRVNGALAVSRAIGDRGLKEYVVADPDIITRKLSESDEFLVVASDGLWDFVTDQECVDIAKASLPEVTPSALENAAKTLVEVACERGSNDDVSVVIVHLIEYRSKLQDAIRENQTSAVVENATVEACLFDLSLQQDNAASQTDGQFSIVEEPDPLPTPRNSARAGRSTW